MWKEGFEEVGTLSWFKSLRFKTAISFRRLESSISPGFFLRTRFRSFSARSGRIM